MSRPTIRSTILLRSVQELCADGETAYTAVMMSRRHRWFVPYAIVAGIGVGIVAAVSGLEGPVNWILFGLIGGAIAGLSTTNYYVLAESDRGLLLCRSSRVRQYAKQLLHRMPRDTELTMVGSTVISSDWKIDGVIYSMTKRAEAVMRQLAMNDEG